MVHLFLGGYSYGDMPRLTDQSYLRIHDQLRRFWLHDYLGYAELTPSEQRVLHDYFRPSDGLTNAELLQHRTDVTARRPSLPAQAGKAYANLIAEVAHLAATRQQLHRRPLDRSRRTRREQHVVAKSVIRSVPDVRRLARALMLMARTEAQAQGSAPATPLGDLPV